jgi:hypothetical protein
MSAWASIGVRLPLASCLVISHRHPARPITAASDSFDDAPPVISQSTLQRIMNRISATAASLRWTESDVLTIDMYIEAAIAWRDALKWLTEDLQADVQDLEEMKREKEERERGVREEEKGEEEEEENEQEKEGADEEGEGVLLREESAAIEV